ncbi:MAG: hypothetical protein GQ474_05955 [Sulfurimonas sp.]|nr:hypothetical protein [Sulfurimonas sp.]
MSILPDLKQKLCYFTPTTEDIKEVTQWLQRRHPKHNMKRELTWYYAYLVLEVSEVSIRNYVRSGILKDLTIPSLALFIAKRDLLWERYGRPEDEENEDQLINVLIEELNEIRALNGKPTYQEEQLLLAKRQLLFIPDYETIHDDELMKKPKSKFKSKTKKFTAKPLKNTIKISAPFKQTVFNDYYTETGHSENE